MTAPILEAIARGFHHGPAYDQRFVEIVLALAFVAAAAVVIGRLVARRRSEAAARRIHERRLAEVGPSARELAALGVLARFLRPWEPPYLLLASRHVFDRCAREMLRAGAPDADFAVTDAELTLNSLRLRIGFHLATADDTPDSSLDLPVGSTILVSRENADHPDGPFVQGKIAAQGPRAMTISLPTGSRPPPEGSVLMLQFRNQAGVFSFSGTVLYAGETAVQVSQSSTIARRQRRRYYRRRVRLSVSVRAAPGAAWQPALLLDLGGGGGSIQRAGSLSPQPEPFEISFSVPPGDRPVAARVVRVSRNGNVASFEFVSLSEAQRDRIIRIAARQPAGEHDGSERPRSA